jgi:hypothetical protein
LYPRRGAEQATIGGLFRASSTHGFLGLELERQRSQQTGGEVN